MRLYRCFPWNRRAAATAPYGPLWVPRDWQGDGRHDNPETFGCLYVADSAVSAVVEQLAPFRTQPLQPPLLRKLGLPLAVAALELPDRVALIDLDDPRVLLREALRPSRVTTRQRDITQPQALALYRSRPRAAGLRWWSTFEATWMNATLFDRAVPDLDVAEVRELTTTDPVVTEAADYLGLSRVT